MGKLKEKALKLLHDTPREYMTKARFDEITSMFCPERLQIMEWVIESLRFSHNKSIIVIIEQGNYLKRVEDSYTDTVTRCSSKGNCVSTTYTRNVPSCPHLEIPYRQINGSYDYYGYIIELTIEIYYAFLKLINGGK